MQSRNLNSFNKLLLQTETKVTDEVVWQADDTKYHSSQDAEDNYKLYATGRGKCGDRILALVDVHRLDDHQIVVE